MRILVTVPQGEVFDMHFPKQVVSRLHRLGDVTFNLGRQQMTPDQLAHWLSIADIVLTHWGTPQITASMLDGAPRLKLLAHGAGTVAHIASEAFYERGIPVISANSVMAWHVAESVLGYMLSALHCIPAMDRDMHIGIWRRRKGEIQGLSGCDIGLVGLGTVGRNLLNLLRPFRCRVHVYDPYLTENALDEWAFAERCSFEEAMRCPVVSVHAAQTPETYHMIDNKALSLMPDGALLVNTARGSLVETKALIAELRTGRISAVLDVFEEEGPCKVPPQLARLDNVLLQPHAAASAVTWQMTMAVIEDIERFMRGERLQLEIPHSQYIRMTQE